MQSNGHAKDNKRSRSTEIANKQSDFVFDKAIFSNVFNKDIRRVYIYRKSERLAKAIQLILPAFNSNVSVSSRLEDIMVNLIDACTQETGTIKDVISKELLVLISLMSVARVGGMLSEVNADLMIRESMQLMQEILSYDEPLLSLEDVPTIAEFARQSNRAREASAPSITLSRVFDSNETKQESKGHISDTVKQSDRQEAILNVLRTKGPSYIKDISTVVRDVSEKTIQRELQTLVLLGKVTRSGERRWTQYQLR